MKENERNNYGSKRVSVHAHEDMKNGKSEWGNWERKRSRGEIAWELGAREVEWKK